MCRLASERAADAWAIGGNMIKQAIALGLHKDPLSLDPNISMRDAEVRRRLWWVYFHCHKSTAYSSH